MRKPGAFSPQWGHVGAVLETSFPQVLHFTSSAIFYLLFCCCFMSTFDFQPFIFFIYLLSLVLMEVVEDIEYILLGDYVQWLLKLTFFCKHREQQAFLSRCLIHRFLLL